MSLNTYPVRINRMGMCAHTSGQGRWAALFFHTPVAFSCPLTIQNLIRCPHPAFSLLVPRPCLGGLGEPQSAFASASRTPTPLVRVRPHAAPAELGLRYTSCTCGSQLHGHCCAWPPEGVHTSRCSYYSPHTLTPHPGMGVSSRALLCYREATV